MLLSDVLPARSQQTFGLPIFEFIFGYDLFWSGLNHALCLTPEQEEGWWAAADEDAELVEVEREENEYLYRVMGGLG